MAKTSPILLPAIRSLRVHSATHAFWRVIAMSFLPRILYSAIHGVRGAGLRAAAPTVFHWDVCGGREDAGASTLATGVAKWSTREVIRCIEARWGSPYTFIWHVLRKISTED
jgi:hypothetical protein